MPIHVSPLRLVALVALLAASDARGAAPDAAARAGAFASAREAPGAPTSATPARAAADSESAPAPLLRPGRPSPEAAPPEDPKARARRFFELGRALERQHSPAAAIASYRNALKFDPKIVGPNERMGRLFFDAGQFGEAAKCFAAELARRPSSVDLARRLGLSQARNGQARAAIATLADLVRKHPNDGDSWQALGFAYMAGKHPRDAEIALRRAVALPPNRADKHRDLGVVLASVGKEREARAEYRRAAAADPHDPASWVNLANLDRRAGQLEDALQEYRAASARDSLYALAWQGQVQTLLALHREDEAGEAYRRWLRAVPGDASARYDAVRFFDGRGRPDVALEIARDGVRADDASGDAHLVLGMALQSTGNTRAALAEMRKAELRFPDRTGRERARQLIGALRELAPDSLRALFVADSVAHRDATK